MTDFRDRDFISIELLRTSRNCRFNEPERTVRGFRCVGGRRHRIDDASAESSSPEGESAAALCRCAELAGIPVLVSVFGSAGEPKIDDDGVAALAGASVHARDAFNPRDGGDLVAALDGTERRRLILLGGWCEATVVMAALSALVDQSSNAEPRS